MLTIGGYSCPGDMRHKLGYRLVRKGKKMLAFHLLWSSVAGFALLIAGMKLTEAALTRWAGHRLAQWLGQATSTPLRGFLFGTVITAALQSSTAVTVLTISFVNAGWISFSRSLGIILGTNVGTTVTTEIMGFQIHQYGWFVLAAACGIWLWTAAANEMRSRIAAQQSLFLPLRYGAVALAGFGLLLAGFDMLVGIGRHLQNSALFSRLLDAASGQPVLVMIAGALLTAMVHSSAAVIGMAMAAAGAGLLPLDAGIAVVLGANVGTCFTGLAASLSGGPGGQFTALAQLALNVAGAVAFLPLIPLLAGVSAYLAPANAAAQIAHAQTLFNLVCSLAALPLAYWPGWERLSPRRES
mgnify:FL=1